MERAKRRGSSLTSPFEAGRPYPPNWRDLPQQPNHNLTTRVNKSVHLAPTRRTILAAGILSVAMIFAAPTSEAVSITWGAAQTITGDSDVSTSGTLVRAINIGAPAPPAWPIPR